MVLSHNVGEYVCCNVCFTGLAELSQHRCQGRAFFSFLLHVDAQVAGIICRNVALSR
jgi:hypothetical protein